MHLRGALVLLCLALIGGPAIAWGDVFPEEELWSDPIGSSVEITGLSRYPDHVFYLYPVACTTELAKILDKEVIWQDEERKAPNYLELGDGPIETWLGGSSECEPSILYALARDIAVTLDLAAMTPVELDEFFKGDGRLFEAEFVFIDRPLYASKGSPLQHVHEVARVLRIHESKIEMTTDAATYRFADGVEQTLKLGHTGFPPLPFRPLKPTKVAKYAMVNAKWEARQPIEPPPAPRLPENYEPPTDSAALETDSAADETDTGAGLPVAATAAAAVGEAVEPVAPVEPVVAVAVAPVAPVAVPTPVVPVSAQPAPTVDVAALQADETAPEPVVATIDPLSSRAWPAAVGLAVIVVIGGVVLLRRKRS